MRANRSYWGPANFFNCFFTWDYTLWDISKSIVISEIITRNFRDSKKVRKLGAWHLVFKEDELYGAVMTAINRLLAGGNNMIKTLEENIHAVIGETTEYQISEINNLLEEKQKELIKQANKGQDYEHLADEIDGLRDKRQTLLVEDASLSGENERINELIAFIRINKYRTLRYDDTLVRKIIQNVTVYDDHFVICFKSGIEIEVWKSYDIWR